MYMPSKKLDIVQSSLKEDPFLKLSEWKSIVLDLTEEHDQDMVLYTDSGYDDCQLFLTADKDIEQRIEQTKIDTNPSMTLKQWKECIVNLIDVYGQDSYMYTHAGRSNVTFYLSPIDRK